jgi:hypothetical protein
LAIGCAKSQTVVDPIPDIPISQQRTVQRHDFEPGWPFQVGTGTLGCRDGAVSFRAGGVTYALNDAARSRFPAAEPIRVFQSAAPSNPLARLKQDERMHIFAELAACDQSGSSLSCKQRLRERAGLSEAELKQIDDEGIERRWPPLKRDYVPLDSVLTAGRNLCNR